jgi:hypothetical protein
MVGNDHVGCLGRGHARVQRFENADGEDATDDLSEDEPGR